jgi:hypothetical protein
VIPSRRLTAVKSHYGVVSCLWILLALPAAANTTGIPMSSTTAEAPFVSVIDAATNKIEETIQHIWIPHGSAFSPEGRWSCITSEIRDAVSNDGGP